MTYAADTNQSYLIICLLMRLGWRIHKVVCLHLSKQAVCCCIVCFCLEDFGGGSKLCLCICMSYLSRNLVQRKTYLRRFLVSWGQGRHSMIVRGLSLQSKGTVIFQALVVYPPMKNYRVHMYTISLEVVKTTTIRPRDQLSHTKPLV